MMKIFAKSMAILCIGSILITPTVVSATEVKNNNNVEVKENISNYKVYNSFEEAQLDISRPEIFIIKNK